MNYTHLQESIWRALGLHDSGQRQDWQRQEIRDSINTIYQRLANIRPFLWQLTRETTVSIVSGTSTYRIDDWCVRPLSFYVVGEQARDVVFRNPRNVDRDGSRNTNLVASLEPWELTWTPANSTSARSGAAAAVTEAATSVTGLTGLTSADVGRMILINGEPGDYEITAQASTSCTIDKAFKGYLTGLGTTGAASNYSSKKWQIGPPGRYQIQVIPTPAAAATLSVRYQRKPRRLILDDDTPEIMEEYHDLLWKGAYCLLSGLKKDDLSYGMFKGEWIEGWNELKSVDELQLWEDQDQVYYESMLDQSRWGNRNNEQPGTYNRYE